MSGFARHVFPIFLGLVLALPLVPAAIPGDVDGGHEYVHGDLNWIDYQLHTFNAKPKVIGNLTWNGGTTAIKWGPNPSSEDNKPDAPVDPVPLATGAVNNCFNDPECGTPLAVGAPGPYAVTSGLEVPESVPAAEAYPMDVFTSEALTRDVYIDPQRGIDVVLYLQARQEDVGGTADPFNPTAATNQLFPCDEARMFSDPDSGSFMEPYWPVELWVGNTRVAGGVPPNDWNVNSGAPDADGYGHCDYEMHPEVPVLRAGDVLTLKVIHVREKHHWSYGFSGDHRSQVRIAEFDTQTLLERRPDLVPVADGGTLGAPTESGVAWMPWLGGLLLFVPRMGRSRAYALLLACLLVAMATSGCLSGGGPGRVAPTVLGTSGSVNETLVPLRPEEIHGAGNGTIFGVILDDLGLTVSTVRITLEGTPNWTVSDQNGKFSFDAVPEGSYTIRFDHTQYVFFQDEVTVKAGLGTSLKVTLYLKNPTERDARKHPHPGNWNGQDTYAWPVWVLPSRCSVDACDHPHQRFFPESQAGKPAAIFPGTTELEVKLSWDTGAMGVQRLGLAYYRTDSGSADLRVFTPRGPDQPFRIQVTWGMTDDGHSLYTGWRFYWYIPLSEGPDFAKARTQMAPAQDPGAITVKMFNHRGGEMPWEPGHTDFWKGKESLPAGAGAITPVVGTLPTEEAPCIADPGWPAPPLCDALTYDNVRGGRIPPDAKKIKVVATLNRELLPVASPVQFWYKTAATRPLAWGGPSSLEFFKQVDASAVSRSDLTFTFTIPVTEAIADGFYSSPAWAYTFRWSDETAAWADAHGTGAASDVAPPIKMTIAVTVFKDA